MVSHISRVQDVNLHQLRLFASVVRAGSFTQAARQHFISQSALSSQVRQLETAVGTPLFTRVHGAVVPSEAGRRLFAWADSLLEHVEACAEGIRQLSAAAGRTVSVGVSPTGAFYPLVEALHEYRVQHPETSVRLSIEPTRDLLAAVSAGTLDMALEWEPVQRDDLAWRPLAEADFFVVVSPLNPAASHEVMPASTFRANPFLGLRQGFGMHGIVEATLARLGLWPDTVTYLPSIDAIKRAVAADLGFGLVSAMSSHRELEERALVGVRLEGFELRRRVLLVWRRDGWRSEAAEELIAFLAESPVFRLYR